MSTPNTAAENTPAAILRLNDHEVSPDDGGDLWRLAIGTAVSMAVTGTDGTTEASRLHGAVGSWQPVSGWLRGPLAQHGERLFGGKALGPLLTARTSALYQDLVEAEAAWRAAGNRTFPLLFAPDANGEPGKLPTVQPSRNPFALASAAPFASGAPALGAADALLHARRWEEDEAGIPHFVRRVNGRDFKGIFEYRIIVPPAVSEADAQRTHKQLVEHILRDMGWDTVWLHMLFLAYAAHTEEHQPAAIPRAMFYKALGLDRRTDLTRAEKDRRCQDELQRLRSLGLKIVSARLNGQDLDYHSRDTVVWQVTKDEYGQARFEAENGGWVKKWDEWQALVRPGEWGAPFLYHHPMRQLGYLSPQMFDMDRKRAPGSASLAVLLAFRGRFPPVQRRVHLPNAGILQFADKDPVAADRRAKNEYTEWLINAAEEQRKWGAIPDYSEWPAYLRPGGDADRADGIITGDGSEATPKRRPTGYFEQLMEVGTSFTLPEEIYELNRGQSREAPKLIDRGRRAQSPPPQASAPQTWRASDVKLLRERLGLTQEALGERLGVSKTMARFIEQGKRRITPDQAGRLAALVGPGGG